MAEQRYHVFLSHSAADTNAAIELARWLKRQGISVWLDKWNLVPGRTWLEDIQKALRNYDCFAIIVGREAEPTQWQSQATQTAIQRRVENPGKVRVIRVLLPGAASARVQTDLARHTWVELSSLSDPVGLHRLRCGILNIEPGDVPPERSPTAPPPASGTPPVATPAPTPRAVNAPYKGLHAFDVDDAPFFFGREEVTQTIVNRIDDCVAHPNQFRFITIYGRSGSGKSSIARAGVLGQLGNRNRKGQKQWRLLRLIPGSDPLHALARKLHSAFPDTQIPTDLIEYMIEDSRTLSRVLVESLPGAGRGSSAAVLVDQFEECFTLCEDAAARK